MSDTPIYDTLSEMQKAAHRNGAFKLKVSILDWVKAEILAGRLKSTVDVEKIIKGIERIETWESTSQNESQSTGSGSGTGSKTSGTRSRSPRSNAESKPSRAGSKATSAKAK
jgi:hypothetical protein